MNFYTFRKENLTYNKVRFKLKYLLSFVVIQFCIAVILLTFISTLYDTPKEKRLREDTSYLLYEFNEINQKIIQTEAMLDEVIEHDSIIYSSIFDTTVIRKSFDVEYESVSENQYSKIVDASNQKLSELNQRMEKELYSLKSLERTAASHQKMLIHLPAIQPIDNKDLKRTASGWGMRIHPILHIRKFHYGLDFAAPMGTEIYATGDATVQTIIKSTEVASQGYGNLIILNHGYGYKTLYAHLSKFNVKKGQKVKRGEVIGFIGSTGVSTGPHLHYEVIQNGVKTNPAFYFFGDLTPLEFQKILDISNSMNKSLD